MRSIKNYSKAKFGSSRFHTWLCLYATFRSKFLEGWIPVDVYGTLILPRINKPHRVVSYAKSLSQRLFGEEHSADRACYVSGTWLGRDGRVIDPAKAKDYIFAKTDHVYVKRDDSRAGIGVSVVRPEEFDCAILAKAGDFVVQTPIKQAKWFDAIFPGCLATLRITTVFIPGIGPQKRAAYLRVGRGDAKFIKNTHVRVSVTDDPGSLDSRGVDEKWKILDAHPDTGFKFSGAVIPHFRDAVALCESLHFRVPQFMVIGWDIGIGEAETSS